MQTTIPLPANERQRLVRLADYGIFNTEPDLVLDQFVALAAEVAGTRFAFFNLIGNEELLTKSAFSAATGFESRDGAMCAHTIAQPDAPLIVSDLSQDERFAQNKHVTGDEAMRFYAGVPIDADNVSAIGTLCVMDTTPRSLSDKQLAGLKTLAIGIESHITLRRLSARWNAVERSGAHPAQAPVDEETIDRQVSRAMMILDVERAIEHREFVNYYQPKVNLKTKKIDGGEALIRWNHPTRGLVHPFEFISLLEETGLIVDVGMQVIEQAMADWKDWFDNDLIPPQIAVNVAALQFSDSAFIDKVTTAVLSSGFGFRTASPLSIEVTESSLISNLDSIADSLHALQNIGVPIALDDFGTGFSSLAYIATLPIDILKIDRSFVVKMTTDAKYMGLVTTIINLAHSLDMKVVAEGVETEEEAKLLRLLRCEHAQGYLYSKPVAAGEFMKLLQDQESEGLGLAKFG